MIMSNNVKNYFTQACCNYHTITTLRLTMATTGYVSNVALCEVKMLHVHNCSKHVTDRYNCNITMYI